MALVKKTEDIGVRIKGKPSGAAAQLGPPATRILIYGNRDGIPANFGMSQTGFPEQISQVSSLSSYLGDLQFTQTRFGESCPSNAHKGNVH